MHLINWEIDLILNWSANCLIIDAFINNQIPIFAITDTKLYVPVVTLLSQDKKKLLEQLKSGFQRTIDWNKYQSKAKILERNRYLDYLIDSSFQGVSRLLFYHFKIILVEEVTNIIFR